MVRFWRRAKDAVPSIWVAELRISDRTAGKLSSKHRLQPEKVRDAVQCIPGLRCSWTEHPERGQRAIIETTISGRRVMVVLYPVNDPVGDVWNLGSAYEI